MSNIPTTISHAVKIEAVARGQAQKGKNVSSVYTNVNCAYVDTVQVPGDLNNAHRWYVKWRRVHVWWTEGGDECIYEDGHAGMDFKRPENVDTEITSEGEYDCLSDSE